MTRNRFVYAKLIDHDFNHKDPLVLLELGIESPVDWEAVDGKGEVICKQLDFVLTVASVKIAGEPLDILCVYDRIVRDYGNHEGLYVYVLGLRPVVDTHGGDSYQTALKTVVNESVARDRSWCADISRVLVSWKHFPDSINCLDNDAYRPEMTVTEPSLPEGEMDVSLDPETDEPRTDGEVDVQLDLETDEHRLYCEEDIRLDLEADEPLPRDADIRLDPQTDVTRPEGDYVDSGLELDLLQSA